MRNKKKLLLLMMILLATGCNKKLIKCTKEDLSSEYSQTENVTLLFQNDKLKEVTSVSNVTYESDDLATSNGVNIEQNIESLNKEKGVEAQISQNGKELSLKMNLKLDIISQRVLDLLDYTITRDAPIGVVKAEMIEKNYTCE